MVEQRRTGRQLEHLRLLCGPAIIFASIGALAFPVIATASVYTLAFLGILLIGVVVTVAEGCFSFRTQFATLQRSVYERLNQIVLDDVLRSVFSLEYGAIPCAVSSFYGAMGLCNLPLTDEQRARMFQWAFDLPRECDARDALTAPGGFLRLLPDPWNKSLKLGDQGACVVLDSLHEVTGSDSDNSAKGEAVRCLDLSWDAESHSRSTAASSAVNSPDGSNEDRIDHHILPRSEVSQEDGSVVRDETARRNQNIDSAGLDPVHLEDVLSSIFVHIIVIMKRKALSQLNEKSLRLLGLGSTSILILQLRSSKVARKILHAALHASVVFGLASVALGSILLSETKRIEERNRSIYSLYSPSHYVDTFGFGTKQIEGVGLLLKNQNFRKRLQMLIALFVVTNIGRKLRRARI